MVFKRRSPLSRTPAVVITDAKREIKPNPSNMYIKPQQPDKSDVLSGIAFSFSATKAVHPYIAIDDNKGVIKIPDGKNEIYLRYDQIINCEIYIDDVVGSNTGLLGAAAGGLLFGGTGAIVGGMAGKTNVEYVDSISVRIRTNSNTNSSITVKTLKYKSQTGTKTVSKAIEDARAIEDLIIYAMNSSKRNVAQSVSAETKGNELGYIEELRKLKELADEGIITQDEFEAKKKQLLS